MKSFFIPPTRMQGYNIVTLQDLQQYFSFSEFWGQRNAFVNYFDHYPERIGNEFKTAYEILSNWIKGKHKINQDIHLETESFKRIQEKYCGEGKDFLGLATLLSVVYRPSLEKLDGEIPEKLDMEIRSTFLKYAVEVNPVMTSEKFLEKYEYLLQGSHCIESTPILLREFKESNIYFESKKRSANPELSLCRIRYIGNGTCRVSIDEDYWILADGEQRLGVFDQTGVCWCLLDEKGHCDDFSVLSTVEDEMYSISVSLNKMMAQYHVPYVTSFALVGDFLLFVQYKAKVPGAGKVMAMYFDEKGDMTIGELEEFPELCLVQDTIACAKAKFPESGILAIQDDLRDCIPMYKGRGYGKRYKIITTKGIF